ncbi:phosphoadenosine phosphosulfate reductase, partial [Vibrio antiquarius]
MLDSVASRLELIELLTLTKTEQILRLAQINVELEKLSAQDRVKWALENLEGEFAVSSSF